MTMHVPTLLPMGDRIGLRHLAGAAWMAILLLPAVSHAQVMGCQAIAASPLRVIPAAYAEEMAVRLTFIGHATFLIESPGKVRVATDYNDRIRPPVVPDLITMNRAHSTHYTNRPDPAIKHVLRGWEAGGVARHNLVVGDMRIRNVPTNIREWGGGGTISGGNSIFIFETAGLCIAHLGHLHHTLTPEHLAELGPVDVVLVPVDGGLTLDVPSMMEVIRNIKARLILPMHYFGAPTLNRFLTQAREFFPTIEFSRTAEITVKKETLPGEPKILVLPGPH